MMPLRSIMRRARRAAACLTPLLVLATSGSAALAEDGEVVVQCVEVGKDDKKLECTSDGGKSGTELTFAIDASICNGAAPTGFDPPKLDLTQPEDPPATPVPLACEFRAAGQSDAKKMRFECRAAATSDVKIERLKGTLTCPGESKKLPVVGKVDSGGKGRESPGSGERPAASGALRSLPASIWKAALLEINVSIAGQRLGNYYDRSNDLTVLFFNADGAPYFPLPDVIDEDDDIYIVVADYEDRLGEANISISGCNRPQIEARVAGRECSGVPVFSAGPGKGAAPPPRRIGYLIRPFGKCAGAASGGPQLTVKTQVTTIPVNPLYRFAVGAALAYDNTATRTFALRTPPGEGIARITEEDDRMGLSSLIFISFYLGGRDFRKRDLFLPQRFQLFVGLDPRAFDKHLVGGLGYELTVGMNALVGWRFLTKQPVLAEGSGLRVGDSFDGTAEAIPTRERWEIGSVFLGVGLSTDLLARLR